MPVAGKWVARLPGDPDGSAATANAQCHNGEPLACAVATWMAMAPQLDTLLLADCGPLRGRLVLPRWDNEGGDEKGTGKAGGGDDANRASIFDFERKPWLRGLDALHLRCYWPAKEAFKGNWHKSAVLLRALLMTMPTKRFFLKLDADALLWPSGLLRFLTRLSGVTHPSTPVYFGTVFGPTGCLGSFSGHCANHAPASWTLFGRAAEDRNRSRRGAAAAPVQVRDTAAWRTLQRELADTPAAVQQARRTAVAYALGPSYGLSRTALERVVASDAQRRVGTLSCGPVPCTRVLGTEMHRHEDANLGLALHLLRVRLVESRCFYAGGSNQPSVARLLHAINRTSSLRRRSHERRICSPSPVSFHPFRVSTGGSAASARTAEQYLAVWHWLRTTQPVRTG